MNKTGTKKRLAEPGIHLYRNLRNPNKYIQLDVYASDGHYYWRNFMHWDNGVTNIIGDTRNRQHRISRTLLAEILEDYEEIPIDYSILP